MALIHGHHRLRLRGPGAWGEGLVGGSKAAGSEARVKVGGVVRKCRWDALPPFTPLAKLDTSVEHYFSAPHFPF